MSVLSIILTTVPAKIRPKLLQAFKATETEVAFTGSKVVLSGIVGLPKALLDDLEQYRFAG